MKHPEQRPYFVFSRSQSRSSCQSGTGRSAGASCASRAAHVESAKDVEALKEAVGSIYHIGVMTGYGMWP